MNVVTIDEFSLKRENQRIDNGALSESPSNYTRDEHNDCRENHGDTMSEHANVGGKEIF